MHGLPSPAFDSLIEAMADVIDYPDDPLRTFPTSDSYIQNVHFRGHLVESSNGCPREERLPVADISADNRGSLIQDAGPGGNRTPGTAG